MSTNRTACHRSFLGYRCRPAIAPSSRGWSLHEARGDSRDEGRNRPQPRSEAAGPGRSSASRSFLVLGVGAASTWYASAKLKSLRYHPVDFAYYHQFHSKVFDSGSPAPLHGPSQRQEFPRLPRARWPGPSPPGDPPRTGSPSSRRSFSGSVRAPWYCLDSERSSSFPP